MRMGFNIDIFIESLQFVVKVQQNPDCSLSLARLVKREGDKGRVFSPLS